MDQNLEPKIDPNPPKKLIAVRVPPEKVGMYLLGATSDRTFVGYIKGAMTDEEIQEYIEVQKRLALPRREDTDSLPDADDDDEDSGTTASGSGSSSPDSSSSPKKVAENLETIQEEEDGDEAEEEEGMEDVVEDATTNLDAEEVEDSSSE